MYRAAHLTETEGAFTVDVAGDVAVLSTYRAFPSGPELTLAERVAEVTGARSVYLKRRPVEAKHVANTARALLSPPDPVIGEAAPEVVALEGGVPFLIRPGADLSVGLFTDARPARAWVRDHAGARVLNTFAYTCGFGLMARLGGAEVVKNLDASRKVLSWGQENYALSGVEAPDEDFIYGDVFDWLARFARQERAFDVVVLDPPSFARGKSGTWRAERDYGTLAAAAARVVAPGGALLAMTNHAGVPEDLFAREALAGVRGAGRRGHVEARLGAGEDYPGAAHLKVLALRLA